MTGRTSVIIFLFYLTSLLTILLAVVLPFWVSTKVDHGVQEVQVVKNIESGLWWKYERYEAKPESFPDSDDGWTRVFGTHLDTKHVETVRGLLTTGMSVLSMSFVWFAILFCLTRCCSKDNFRVQFILTTAMLFLAAGFIAVGLIVFYKEVLDEYKLGENDEHLGVSFWLVVTAAFTTFLTGLCTSYLTCCMTNKN